MFLKWVIWPAKVEELVSGLCASSTLGNPQDEPGRLGPRRRGEIRQVPHGAWLCLEMNVIHDHKRSRSEFHDVSCAIPSKQSQFPPPINRFQKVSWSLKKTCEWTWRLETELRIWMKPRRGSSCFLAKHRRVKDVHFLRTRGSSFFLCVGNRTPCFFFKEGSRIYVWPDHTHIARGRTSTDWRMKCKIIMVASVASMTVDACSLYGESIFADLLKPFECQIYLLISNLEQDMVYG